MIPRGRLGPHRGLEYIVNIFHTIPLPEEHIRVVKILFVQITTQRGIMGNTGGKKLQSYIYFIFILNILRYCSNNDSGVKLGVW